jgi:hypothetical protein
MRKEIKSTPPSIEFEQFTKALLRVSPKEIAERKAAYEQGRPRRRQPKPPPQPA